MSRAMIAQLVYLMDKAFAAEGQTDGAHSLLENLRAVRDED